LVLAPRECPRWGEYIIGAIVWRYEAETFVREKPLQHASGFTIT
jgi:hypothetical protein